MHLLVTLKLLCDLCFYFTIGGFIGAAFGAGRLMEALPFFGLAVYLSSALHHRRYLKYLPAGLLVVPLLTSGPVGFFVMLPAVAYTMYYISKFPMDIFRIDYSRQFSLFINSFVVIMILGIIAFPEGLEYNSAPFALAFFALSITLMRMLRHNEEVLKQTRFKVINALSVAGALAIGYLASSKPFLNICKAALGFVYNRLIMPLLILIIRGLMYVLWPVFSLLELADMEDFNQADNVVIGVGKIFDEDVSGNAGLGYDIVKFLLAAGAVAVLAYMAIRLFRALSDNVHKSGESQGILEEREALSGADPKDRGRKNKLGPIREVYRKYLLLLKSRGVEIKPHMTSGDIARISAKTFEEDEASQNIREIYIKTRYGEKPLDKSDVKKSKDLYQVFKKKS